MKAPPGTIPEVVVKVYNKYDRDTESNHVYLPSIASVEEEEKAGSGEDKDILEEEAVEAGAMTAKNSPEDGKEAGEKKSGMQEKEGKETPKATVFYFLQVAFLCAAILFVLLLLAGILMGGRRSKKKRRRKK